MEHEYDSRDFLRHSTGMMMGLAILSTAGCVGAKDGHCVFGGGDLMDADDRTTICVVPIANVESTRVSENGLFSLSTGDRITLELHDSQKFPEGYSWVPFGIPRNYEGSGLDSVEGVFLQALEDRGNPECTLYGNVVEPVWRRMAAYYADTIDRKTLVSASAAQLRMEEIDAFSEVMLETLEGCADGGEETETAASSGTGGTTAVGTGTGDSGSDSMTSSTTGGRCSSNEDCDVERPYCDVPSGDCMPCDRAPLDEQDLACAEAEPGNRPYCVEGECMECRPGVDDPCGGYCHEEDFVCVPCTQHDECGRAACNKFEGTCLPDTDQDVVSAAASMNYGGLQALVNAAGPAGRTIIMENGNYGGAGVVVDGGKLIAFIAEKGANAAWRDTSGGDGDGSPQLTVMGGSTVLADRLEISRNDDNQEPGVLVTGARLWVDRGSVVRNEGGAMRAIASSEVYLRNVFLGQDDDGVDALSVGYNTTVDILYSTVVAGGWTNDIPSNAITCLSPSTSNIVVRNSIVFARGYYALLGVMYGNSDIDDSCTSMNISVEYSFIEDNNGVVDDVTVTEVSLSGYESVDALFNSVTSGNYHLVGDGPMTFVNIAQWRTGDPPTDIDGDTRTDIPDGPDYAGADRP